MTMALAMGGMGMPNSLDGGEFIPTETDTERSKRLAIAEIERNKANGLKEFKYGYGKVYAINQKNADKKAKKLGYI